MGPRFLLVTALAIGLGAAAERADARGAAGAGAAAMRGGKAAMIKQNRMKAVMSQRPKGMGSEKSARQLRVSRRQLQRAMSRRDTGKLTSETTRARLAFARDGVDKPAADSNSAERTRKRSTRKRSSSRRHR